MYHQVYHLIHHITYCQPSVSLKGELRLEIFNVMDKMSGLIRDNFKVDLEKKYLDMR